MNDFDHDELAPAHEQYFNKSGDMVKGSPDDMPKVLATSEYGDQYVNVDIMFIWETSLSRGRVTKRKHNQDGNVRGVANPNPILDTRQYIVDPKTGLKLSLPQMPLPNPCILNVMRMETNTYFLAVSLTTAKVP